MVGSKKFSLDLAQSSASMRTVTFLTDRLGIWPEAAMGEQLLSIDRFVTTIFGVFAVASLIFPSIFGYVFAVACCICFAAGCVAFVAAYWLGLQRSRTEHVTVAGIYALAGSAPRDIRRSFHTLTIAQLVVALVTASMRPYTLQAFGILVPVFGIGLAGYWAVRYGEFKSREVESSHRQAPGRLDDAVDDATGVGAQTLSAQQAKKTPAEQRKVKDGRQS